MEDTDSSRECSSPLFTAKRQLRENNSEDVTQHLVNGTDNMLQSHVNLMKTKVDTLRALLSDKDSEYAEMCQQFEQNLRHKQQQMKSLETHLNKMSSQNKQLQVEMAAKNNHIKTMELTVSKLQAALHQKDAKLLHFSQQEHSFKDGYHVLVAKLQQAESKLMEREQELQKVTRECELVRQVQSNEISRLAESNAILREGLESSSIKVEEKEEQLHKLRQELTSAVAVASERSNQISDLEQMFKQKMTQVSTIQEYLAEEHKKCTNLEKNMEEANKELHQLRQQHTSGGSTMNQYTQTSQSNDCISCECHCATSSKSSNQDPDELEALKKYHEDLEGTVSQLENILHVREKRITDLETKLSEVVQAQKQQQKELRLEALQSEMEEKDTSIALLEISDGSNCHRDEIVELQQQKNVLMKMIKHHVGGGEDMQLVVDKAATQLRCLLQQLVSLVKQDQPVQLEKLAAKLNKDGSHDHTGLLTHANVILNESLQYFKPHSPQLT
ncbi:putative leucine-rich repeat-containing protein DDB_G0290503 isoform X2 [Dysidea avara]